MIKKNSTQCKTYSGSSLKNAHSSDFKSAIIKQSNFRTPRWTARRGSTGRTLRAGGAPRAPIGRNQPMRRGRRGPCPVVKFDSKVM